MSSQGEPAEQPGDAAATSPQNPDAQQESAPCLPSIQRLAIELSTGQATSSSTGFLRLPPITSTQQGGVPQDPDRGLPQVLEPSVDPAAGCAYNDQYLAPQQQFWPPAAPGPALNQALSASQSGMAPSAGYQPRNTAITPEERKPASIPEGLLRCWYVRIRDTLISRLYPINPIADRSPAKCTRCAFHYPGSPNCCAEWLPATHSTNALPCWPCYADGAECDWAKGFNYEADNRTRLATQGYGNSERPS